MLFRRRVAVRVFLLLVAAWLSLPAPRAAGHPGDFATQVWVQTTIADGVIEQEVMVPIAMTLADIFDGITLDDFRALDGDAVRQTLVEFHNTTNPLRIDGHPAPPQVLEQQVTTMATTTPELAIAREDFFKHALLRYVVRYPCDGEPGRVEIVWGQFAVDRGLLIGSTETIGTGSGVEDPARLPLVMTLEAGGMTKLVVLSPSEPAFTWHGEASAPPAELLAVRQAIPEPEPTSKRSRPFPVFSLVALMLGGLMAFMLWRKHATYYALIAVFFGLAGALACYPFAPTARPQLPTAIERPADAEAVKLFTALHRNIYRAFDYNTDTAIYDALAQSVAGPELAAVYNRVYASLILEEEGGAVGRVQAVEVREAAVVEVTEDARAVYRDLAIPFDEDALFAVRAAWTVRGIVSHFGHTHERLNAFEATYTLAPIGGAWRIIDTQLHRQERLDDPAGETDNTGEPLPLLDDLLGEDDANEAEGGTP